jgi:hypothetical protein
LKKIKSFGSILHSQARINKKEIDFVSLLCAGVSFLLEGLSLKAYSKI